jgi:hypothetical protein
LANAIPARLSTPYTAAAGRKFGLTVGIAFAVLSGIALWRGHSTTFAILVGLGATLILAGVAIPAALGPVDRGWMKIALMISRVTTPIFMGIVYFVVITPVAVVRRLFGANSLVHRPGPHGFWFDRHDTARSSLERLF